MEISLSCKDSALPCEVTIDLDNNRYMLRKADTSGEFFNTPEALLEWIKENWSASDFHDPNEYDNLINQLQKMI